MCSSDLGVIEKFGDLKRVPPRVVPAPERVDVYKTCGPMDFGFDEEMALEESKRCLQCDLRCEIAPQKFWNDYVPEEEVAKA